jgi:metal-responsive CopG/Arc/MetJ family transcriptional regulator
MFKIKTINLSINCPEKILKDLDQFCVDNNYHTRNSGAIEILKRGLYAKNGR